MPASPDPRQPRWWPSEPSLLTNTAVCPACFQPLAGTLCSVCGLDLAVPSAADLLSAGAEIVDSETRRQALIARMRVEQHERMLAEQHERVLAAARPAVPATDAVPINPAPRDPAPAYPVPTSPAPAGAAQTMPSYAPGNPVPPAFTAGPLGGPLPPQPPVPPAPALPTGPRRSGIQILMLTVGVILVSIMALFFVLLAYLIASLEVRSVLTGVASIAVFGVAVLLHRRRLSGTAEGISALAVVLFLLDLWIVRANGLFGTGALDGWLYAGISVGTLALLLALCSRALPLRTLSLSAAILAPIALFSLLQGLLADSDPLTRAWTALAAVGAASLGSTRIRRPAERTLIRTGGTVATAFAGLTAFGAFPDLDAGATVAFAIVAVIWFGALAIASTPPTTVSPEPAISPVVQAPQAAPLRPGLGVWAVLAAVGLGLAASGAGLSLFFRGGVADAIFWLPAGVTAVAAVVVASLVRIPMLARLVPGLRVAAAIPLTCAALTMAPSLVASVAITAWGGLTPPFSLAALGTASSTRVPLDVDAPIAVLLVAALGFVCLALLGPVRRVAWAPAWLGAFGLLACGAVIGQPLLSSLVVGALAVAFLTAVARLKTPSVRIAIATVLPLAILAFWTIGLTSTATFPVTFLATIILLGATHQVIVRTIPPAPASALAPVVVGCAVIAIIVGARLIPTWFEAATGGTLAATTPSLWMTVVALVAAGVPLIAGALLRRAESAVVASISAVAVVIGLSELAQGRDTGRLLCALGLTALVALAWQLRPRMAGWPERFVAAAVVPASVLWGIGELWTAVGPELATDPSAGTGVVIASAAVLLAAGAVLLFRRPGARSHPARTAWDVALAVGAVVLIGTVANGPELGWLTLLLLAVTALLAATGDGDLVTGTSPRRHVAWVGFLLAVAALWLGVARADGTDVELYTLPVTGLLLAILLLVRSRRARPEGPAIGRTVILGAALAVGLLPSAVAALDGGVLRPFLVLLIAAGLVVAGALAPPVSRGIQGGVVFWAAGSVAALIVGFGRSVLRTDTGIPFEAWSAGGAVVLLAAGLLWRRASRHPLSYGAVALGAAVAVLALPTVARVFIADVDAWRALLVLVAVCVALVAASVSGAIATRWVAFACGILLVFALLITALAEPFELATAPLAVALIVAGGIRLARDGRRRSWPELGPGLGLLLVPSLLADFAFDNELWRIVALGVAALAVLGIGLALKLQAPTLLGAVTVVLHGLAQLWPWISDLYGTVPWWLWAGIGGVILIVLAATYERRIRDLKAVARGISSLR